MTQLPQAATALLTMQMGVPCSMAEFAILMEQYDYQQDPADEHRFTFEPEKRKDHDGDCSIVIGQLEHPIEELVIYGRSIEHFANLNHLMQKAGWVACNVISIDDEVSVKMMARFVSVRVESQTSHVTMPASTLQSAAVETSAQLAPLGQSVDAQHHNDAAELTSALQASHQRVVDLTERSNAMEEKVSVLESENEALRQQLTLLNTAPVQKGQPGDAQSMHDTNSTSHLNIKLQELLRFIEKHIVLDLSAPSTPLLEDLALIGYVVKPKLVAIS